MNGHMKSVDLEIRFEDLSDVWLELSNTRSAFVTQENFVMFQGTKYSYFFDQRWK